MEPKAKIYLHIGQEGEPSTYKKVDLGTFDTMKEAETLSEIIEDLVRIRAQRANKPR